MHTLHLLRHAKSSADEGEDRERPLSRRGREAARRLGEALPALGTIDLVLCSTALRTRETAALALAGLRPPPRIRYEDGLYLAGPGALLRRLRRLAETDGAVMVIGHNPGLHELAIALASPDSPGYQLLASGKFPTGTRVSFVFAAPWAELGRDRYRVVDYVTPKSLEAED